MDDSCRCRKRRARAFAVYRAPSLRSVSSLFMDLMMFGTRLLLRLLTLGSAVGVGLFAILPCDAIAQGTV
jgi:hypothetical protein